MGQKIRSGGGRSYCKMNNRGNLQKTYTKTTTTTMWERENIKQEHRKVSERTHIHNRQHSHTAIFPQRNSSESFIHVWSNSTSIVTFEWKNRKQSRTEQVVSVKNWGLVVDLVVETIVRVSPNKETDMMSRNLVSIVMKHSTKWKIDSIIKHLLQLLTVLA